MNPLKWVDDHFHGKIDDAVENGIDAAASAAQNVVRELGRELADTKKVVIKSTYEISVEDK